MLLAFTMQRPSASRAENYQLLWDTIASLKQCEQAMQHAFIPVRNISFYFPRDSFHFSPIFLSIAIDQWHVFYAFKDVVSLL